MLENMPDLNFGGILLLERLRPQPSLLKSALLQSHLADQLIHLDSPAEALSSVIFENLDLILLSSDVQGDDSLELLQDLLEQPLGAPVIFVTRPDEMDLAMAALEMGAIVCAIRTGWDAVQLVQLMLLRPQQRKQQALITLDQELELIERRVPDAALVRGLFREKNFQD